MCSIDLESCSKFTEKIVNKARKDHECDCCGGPIPKGTSYLKHFSVFDGSVTNEKQCPACTEMVKKFQADHGQYSNPSYMPQLLQECVDYERGEDDKMYAKWRAELAALYQRGGETLEEDEDDGEEDDEDGEEAGEEAQAGDDQDRQGGGN